MEGFDIPTSIPPTTQVFPIVPQQPSLILKPGDVIRISMPNRGPDITQTVQENGKIKHPILGELNAGGLNIAALRTQISDLLELAPEDVIITVED